MRDAIARAATALGFSDLRIGKPEITPEARTQFESWLHEGFHGTMNYMQRHADLRQQPQQLVPGALSVISVRLPYWPDTAADAHQQLGNPDTAYISRYALGRDYHKVIRSRLQKLADALVLQFGPFEYRAYTDSAPIMEVALASQAGLGWKGKHTLSLSRSGSWYFLGELFTNLPLAVDPPIREHCGDCQRCIDVCPTAAIIAPYRVDARRCISYLTIEYAGEIPVEFRRAMGNRIYGCDDCQLTCPWNRFAVPGDAAFAPRHELDAATLLTLFRWSENEFLTNLEGSPIRRIGYERWQRNLSIALGNVPSSASSSPAIIQALTQQKAHATALVTTHIVWALAQHAAPV